MGSLTRRSRFGICDRRPTIYAVELPPWLPRYTIEELVHRFERFLKDQIFTMMLDQMKKRNIDSDQDASSTASGCVYSFEWVPFNHDAKRATCDDNILATDSSSKEDQPNAPIMSPDNIST